MTFVLSLLASSCDTISIIMVICHEYQCVRADKVYRGTPWEIPTCVSIVSVTDLDKSRVLIEVLTLGGRASLV